ncbi:4-amino-4-deoxychorismate lyase [Niallia circulans]|uniref:aminodeoxychorismate lyase n=1 Tax=Niallia circulans TaxID=1397 RepID=UPI000F44FA38|nr:aminodeoxychorismate lyase [Niallia circulans]AYV68820.1 4-amino-4-deoxychorismate lyase [Niallia circulans]
MYIYLNGQIIRQEEAVISVFDHGFMYGLGLFETLRIYDGHPFLLDDHLKRLNDGLSELNIEKSFEREDAVSVIKTLLSKNNIENAYIRWNVSAGIGMIGLQTETYTQPNTIVYIKPLPKVVDMVEKTGQIVTVPRNTPEGFFRLKSHHYLNNILAKREIGPEQTMEGIFLTKEGYLAEGITSNIFWVVDGELYTPSLQTGILNGITRQFIVKLAQDHGVAVKEGVFSLNILARAKEVFATNSIQEIIPIKRIDKYEYKGKEGPVVTMLYKEYRKHTSQLWSVKELEGIKEW